MTYIKDIATVCAAATTFAQLGLMAGTDTSDEILEAVGRLIGPERRSSQADS